MTNPHAENFYERLGLSPDASEADIKGAFFAAVREYPPEKDAENYKLIREAYDTLINPQSRQEYSARDQYGPEIVALEEELETAREVEDTHRQVRVLKKISKSTWHCLSRRQGVRRSSRPVIQGL